MTVPELIQSICLFRPIKIRITEITPQKILRNFFEYTDKEFNIRGAARLLKIAPATASKELKTLNKKGILQERTERNLKLYKGNLDNPLYIDLKIFYNIRKIKESGLLNELNTFYLKPTIILFGSTSHGLDTESSDFDLCVISERTEEIANISIFEKKINRKIHVFVFKNIKDIKNMHLANNILNGILIQGEAKWI